MADVELSGEEIRRYGRHLIMPEVGMEGQKKLKAASVLLIGAGGLGSPLGLYLAAAGVGRIGIVDFDVVDYSNLQRQILHSTKDVGRPKLASAKERLEGINPFVKIETHEMHLNSENALDLFSRYDIIVDGTDNFPTRYLVNDACVHNRQTECLRKHFPIRRTSFGFCDRRRPMLSMLIPRTAAAGAGSKLRRRRRARNSARNYRHNSSE